MKGLISVLRFSLVASLIVPLLVSLNGCSKKEEAKQEVKVEQKQQGKATATVENLKTGYASEVKHAAWYDIFAKQAQKEKMSGAAVIFRALCQSEKIQCLTTARAC